MEIFKKKEETKGKIQRELDVVKDSSKSERQRIKASSAQLLGQLEENVNTAGRNLGQATADADRRMQEEATKQGKEVAEENNNA